MHYTDFFRQDQDQDFILCAISKVYSVCSLFSERMLQPCGESLLFLLCMMLLFVQMRQAIDTPPVGPALYGHQLQQQQLQQAGNLLHPHHQYHQQRLSAVRNTFQSGCHGDRGDAIPQFEAAAAGCRQMSSDAGILGTSLHRTQQRQSGTSFAASRELSDRACVDRYDYMLIGCDQFAKIS